MLMQTWAMIYDAYRELCARKLFWITMGLSLFVVLIFAAVGINDEGMTILWFTIPIPGVNTDILTPKMYYLGVFQGWGIQMWLGIIASILALVTTAGFFPNMLEAGSIEIHLSKPIGRIRLFLTRYLTGLLFVALQVAVFTTACFFVLGFRAGVWVPTVFLAIPIVVLFFSYLFSFCVFIGIWTRSTMPALMLTLLFWFGLWIINTGDFMLIGFRDGNAKIVEARAARIERLETNTRQSIVEAKGLEGIEGYEPTDEEIVASMPLIAREREAQIEDEASVKSLTAWTTWIYRAKTTLPKTSETVALLDRWLIPEDERLEAQMKAEAAGVDPESRRDGSNSDEDLPQGMDPEAIATEIRSRSVWWIIGSSLGYEVSVLAMAGFIFVRRDY